MPDSIRSLIWEDLGGTDPDVGECASVFLQPQCPDIVWISKEACASALPGQPKLSSERPDD